MQFRQVLNEMLDLPTDSVRAFKERNKIGRFKEITPEEQKRLDEEKKQKEEMEKEKAESMTVGDRYSIHVVLEVTIIFIVQICVKLRIIIDWFRSQSTEITDGFSQVVKLKSNRVN